MVFGSSDCSAPRRASCGARCRTWRSKSSTTVERAPEAIVGPYGHRTALQTNTDGWVTVLEDPTLKQAVLTYPDESGLLESFATRDNHTTHFTWDAKGRLQSHTHPAGGTMTFVRAATASGYSVEKTSPLGRPRSSVAERRDVWAFL